MTDFQHLTSSRGRRVELVKGEHNMSLPEIGARRPDPKPYGRSIEHGLGLNLLVRDVIAAATFQATVLGARVDYWEQHFAIVEAVGSKWLLHSDWSYRGHPLHSTIEGVLVRGRGIEFRLYGVDPDQAEERARKRGAIILSGARDQVEHGLRESHIVDLDGYVWVPSVRLTSGRRDA